MDIKIKKGTSVKKVLFAMLFCVAIPAFAQFGTTAATDENVQSILAKPVDGHRVILRGTIVSNGGDESYQFTDGTAQIGLSINDRLLWGQKLVTGTPVEIEGEVDKRWFSDVFDISVDRVQVLKKENAATDKPASGS